MLHEGADNKPYCGIDGGPLLNNTSRVRKHYTDDKSAVRLGQAKGHLVQMMISYFECISDEIILTYLRG